MTNIEKGQMSKVAMGMRIKIPKDIVEMYRIKKGDMVEWKSDEKGKIEVEIKEMVLKEKKPKIEEVKDKRVVSK